MVPGLDGKLSQEEIAKVQSWMLTYKGGHHPCPICESIQWTIGEYILHPITQGTGTPPIYPNITLLSPCGYTRYVNAVLIGLVPGRRS